MNIIFMGTPDFAVPALQKLIDNTEHNVSAVFTRAPKAKGRGMSLTKSPIHQLAEKHDILVHTPKTLRTEEACELLRNIEADVIVVVAYGFIIPQNILDLKKHGCLNIHPSKLPKYRGAAPLQRTIINGDKETAICVMQMDAGMDTGDIILQEDLEISDKTTLQELHDECAEIGAKLLINTLKGIDSLPRIKQPEECPIYADKLTKEEGEVDWNTSAFEIDCRVRGMNPWPGVFFNHSNKIIKILESEYTSNIHQSKPGEILNDKFEVACGQGTLILKTIKPQGKQKMNASDYLRGLNQ